ncbi:hypothetical protein D1AOALGA4SA_930 [Olavius algarvensis Delta 1 endosymbiont]|nr:hypothetical protein D1AOALGA4SA_930 [Olavius algarvensis Delta 1 endosymbiont]
MLWLIWWRYIVCAEGPAGRCKGKRKKENSEKKDEEMSILNLEPAHKLKIDQNKLQNCRSNILNLVNVL